MAINFPASPSNGDTYVYGGKTWTYDGTATKWVPDDAFSDVTATATELNTLDGITADVTELNYVDGVTSAIQTQLDAKLETVDISSYTGDVDITGELLVDSYNETFVSLSGTTPTVDCEAGNSFALTLSGATTFTFSNPPASGTTYAFTLKLVQDSSGSGYTVTWPSSVDWAAATAPTLTADANAVDVFVFMTHDGGTTWYGFTAGQAMG
jgi:hypothetical protein